MQEMDCEIFFVLLNFGWLDYLVGLHLFSVIIIPKYLNWRFGIKSSIKKSLLCRF